MSNLTIAQIHELADEYGWSVEFDNNGQLVIYTNVYEDNDEPDGDNPKEEQLELYFIDEDGELSLL